jgi:signal transduction histidine kinase
MRTLLKRFLLFFALIWGQLSYANPNTSAQTPNAHLDSLAHAIDRQDFLAAFQFLNDLRSLNLREDDPQFALLKLREGQLYLGMQFYDRAEQCLLESAALFEKNKKALLTGEAYYFLGGVMEQKKESGQKQLGYFKNALGFYQKAKDTLKIVWTYDAIGGAFFKLKDFEKAIDNSRLAATLMMTDSARFYEPNVYTSIGNSYLAKGDLETAQSYLEKSVFAYKNGFNTEGYLIYDAYRLLGTVYLKLDRRAEGMSLLQEALTYCESHIDDPLLVKETFHTLIDDAKSHGDWATALNLQERYVLLRDSLSQREDLIKIEQNHTAMTVFKAEEEQKMLKNQLHNNQVINQTMVFVALLMLCLLVALFSLYRQNRNFNKKLHAEVHRKTQALQQSNNELERFAFIASHDLKTPIRNIISFNKLLERRLGNQADESTKQYLGFVRDYAYMMNNLVENIISFSKIGEKEALKMDKVPMIEVSQQVIHNLQNKIQSRQANVVTEGVLPDIVAYKPHVEQLFQHLVDNALTYNDKPQPQVTIGSIKNGQADRHLFVRDNGIGIDPNYQDKVFEMFSKLNSSQQYKGAGLGLAICKKIVMQYGGRIWLESEKGIGTTVHVVLPAEMGLN